MSEFVSEEDRVCWEKDLLNYRYIKNFKPSVWTISKIHNFNNYLKEHKLTGAVLSVSGGIDSAVTLALLKKTMELEDSNLKKVWVVNQPIHSSDWALDRANELCDKLGFELLVIEQSAYHSMLTDQITLATGVEKNQFSGGQLKSYMRTPVNYYMAQLLTQQGYPALVMGTGNQDEDGYLAYFCKAGDGVVDVQLISDLHKSEVFKVAKYLEIPESIINANPSADLWEGQEDEKELGFTYDFIEFFTGSYLKMTNEEKMKFLKGLKNKENRIKFLRTADKCEAVHERNKHKLDGVINL